MWCTGKGLASNRLVACSMPNLYLHTTWTKCDTIEWHHMASPGHNRWGNTAHNLPLAPPTPSLSPHIYINDELAVIEYTLDTRLIYGVHIDFKFSRFRLLTHWPQGCVGVISNMFLQAHFDDWYIEYLLRYMLKELTGKSILVMVMAWCRHATSHSLNQCWPNS